MNPFTKLPPIPDGSTGLRGYASAAEAKKAAVATGAQSYAVLSASSGVRIGPFSIALGGSEYAWVAPAKAYTQRAAAAMGAGIKLIELVA